MASALGGFGSAGSAPRDSGPGVAAGAAVPVTVPIQPAACAAEGTVGAAAVIATTAAGRMSRLRLETVTRLS
jgi:hypothetical protein